MPQLTELLLLPKKTDSERTQVAQAWQQQGGEVLPIGKFWIPPATANKRVTIYGNDTFALVLAQVIGVQLLSPKDQDLALVETAFVQRKICLLKVESIQELSFPQFLKPVIPKLFVAQVFESLEQLTPVLQQLAPSTWLLCSTPIPIQKEIRAFILNATILDLAYYEGQGAVEEAAAFIQLFLQNTSIALATSFVLDVGWNAQQGWFIIEWNASWGAGLNGCAADKVLPAIRAATIV